jgi:formimidoylglutamate deiminase
MSAKTLWAPKAWIGGAWQAQVLLEVDAQGNWSGITAETAPPAHAQVLSGPVLPGIVNAHSHAFQRAFAGHTECREAEADDFWSWRNQMYGVALQITPEAMYATAKQLYTELQHGGYTHTCEFHYLHHQPSGAPYPNLVEMGVALVQAAHDTGMGLTLLPVLYERAGFTQPSLRDDQRRFATDAKRVLALRDGVRDYVAQHKLNNITVGVAVHSLRAARAQSIAELWTAVKDDPAPIHIHIAEQTGEVDDCLAATGQRPIEWLCNGLGQGIEIDVRWHLVHATHATHAEIDAVAKSGAGMVLCPTTEANLGDGLTDLPYWLASGVPVSIGSDSHVTRDWREELRLAEYGQRLIHRKRNVLADPSRFGGSTAARLFEQAIHAGGQAAGFERWGIQIGARADWVTLSAGTEPADLLGSAATGVDMTLDRCVFSSTGSWGHRS